MKKSVLKRVLGSLLVMALVVGLAVPTIQAKAYYSFFGQMSEVVQTDATDTSATMSWSSVPGASGYELYIDSSEYPAATVDASATSCVLEGLAPGSRYTIYVYPYGIDPATGVKDRGWYSYAYAKTTATVTGVDYYSYGFSSKNSGLSIKWTGQLYSDGYEAVLYNKKGKKVQTVSGANFYATHCDFTKANHKNVYYVKVRTYITLANGYKKYGAESAKFYAIPQPNVTSSNNDVHKNSINMKWKKVTGASSYTIYVSTSSSKKGAKVATTKKNSYTIKKVKGKTINTTKKTYYITVVTNTKIGKKTKKSKDYYSTSAWSYYY